MPYIAERPRRGATLAARNGSVFEATGQLNSLSRSYSPSRSFTTSSIYSSPLLKLRARDAEERAATKEHNLEQRAAQQARQAALALRAADEERAASAQHQRLFHSHTQARLAAEKAQLCQLRASLDEKDAERAEQTLSRMERRAQHAALTMDAAAKQRAAAIQATLNAYSTRADQCARTHAEQRAFFVRRQREVAEAHESAAARIAERREAWLHEHQLCAMENAQVRSEVHQFHQLQIDEKAGADKQAWALRHAELKLRLDARKAMQAQRSGESAARKTEHVERSLSHVEERLRARRERAEQDYARSTMRAETFQHLRETTKRDLLAAKAKA